ncbi:helix-turn-helix transcriptional regulator [Jeotgalibacillus sp. R-1-5s-1]|uniref:ArsR/SmtB family transcription factor n=1 Tax=Jeotgalibacillus sp. R-1-5s-1 TaxID=2555897 RepID=UPI0010691C61|nr:metalloregulator ArsR/SmtB family transcription factor [Jeotgalibacillus sp. R-1-5s-1]TFD92900.1 ArsR family transcriptional regulator [Jeotgalibacillus sp. R-1-5s-1]
MNLLTQGVPDKRIETAFKHLSLYEAALGLAAYTYSEIRHTLEVKEKKWTDLVSALAPDSIKEIEYCTKHNTWRMLLQLIGHYGEDDLAGFVTYINALHNSDLIFKALPPVGTSGQRKLFSIGDRDAFESLIKEYKNDSFFNPYLQFLKEVNTPILKKHLLTLMSDWYRAWAINEQTRYETAMIKERQRINKMKSPAKHLYQKVLGDSFQPPIGVTKIELVPHLIYRPWTIQTMHDDRLIVHYPADDSSLLDESDQAALVLFHKALADENRILLINRLSNKAHSLNELSQELSVGKSTIHHHLAILRSAGIVVLKDQRYSLKSDVLKELHMRSMNRLGLDSYE